MSRMSRQNERKRYMLSLRPDQPIRDVVGDHRYRRAEQQCIDNDHVLGRTPNGTIVCLCDSTPDREA